MYELKLRKALCLAQDDMQIKETAIGDLLREIAESRPYAGQQRDKGQHVSQLLTPIYSWFTEGFETTDPKEAKAILDEPC